MKRRQFVKTLIAGSVALPLGTHLPWSLLASDASPGWVPPDPVGTVPHTPFDGPPGTWTMAVLPDTQYYARDYPEVFLRQTEWIAANKKEHNIIFVAHEGDIVQNNNSSQWEQARTAMNVLNREGVPYALVPGNHDLGRRGRADTRQTLMNDYFTAADYKNSARFGLFEPEKMENSWHEIETPTGKFLLIALEFGPRDEVLEWANQVVGEHPGHRVIVVTHAYLHADHKRNDWERDQDEPRNRGNPKRYELSEHGSVNDGEDMWRKFVSRHSNIDLVLNGHVATGTDGTGYRLDEVGRDGQVHQILANYQDNPRGLSGTVLPPRRYGGGGFLRLMRFHPDGVNVQVESYSPWYDYWLKEPNQQFSLALVPS